MHKDALFVKITGSLIAGYAKSICNILVSFNDYAFSFIIIIITGKFINRYISCIVVDVYWPFYKLDVSQS